MQARDPPGDLEQPSLLDIAVERLSADLKLGGRNGEKIHYRPKCTIRIVRRPDYETNDSRLNLKRGIAERPAYRNWPSVPSRLKLRV